MKTIIQTAAILALTATNAFAQAMGLPTGDIPKNDIPEISALEGTAAIAVLAAIVLLAWERRRRAS